MKTRTASIVAAVVVAALGLAACAPPAPTPDPNAPDHVVEVSPGATPDAIEVSPGDTIEVVGTGFTTTGNLGARPPLAGQPAGVYVTFGRFGDPWKPSEGASSSARQIIEQNWALPTPSYNALGGIAGLVELDGDGGFTVRLTATEASGTNPQYGIGIYPGSGSVNAAEEILVPVEFAGGAA